jgi:hypothetical protein
MDRHLAKPISGLWSPGAAQAVDGASLLHGPLRVDRNGRPGKKVKGWMERGWTQHQSTLFSLLWNKAKSVTSDMLSCCAIQRGNLSCKPLKNLNLFQKAGRKWSFEKKTLQRSLS